MIRLADLNKQHELLKDELDAAITSTIADSAFIGGKYVEKFEAEFAEYIGVPHCIGCGNGTDALEIAIGSLDMPPGAEIIVPVNSFIASAEAVFNTGYVPVLADCQKTDGCVDPSSVERLISDKTAAILVVHLHGHAVNMNAINDLVQKHNLLLIEDSAQAHGAKWSGQNIGTFGDVATFSFFPGKNLGAMGDGGAICCKDDNVAKRCRMMANHGRLSKFRHEMCGRNSRLDGLQAAILSVKLRYLEQWNEQRRTNAQALFEQLKKAPEVTMLTPNDNATSVFHNFVVCVEHRERVKMQLQQRAISTGIHYPYLISDTLPFAQCQTENNVASGMVGKLLSLPIHQYLDATQLHYIAIQLLEACQFSALNNTACFEGSA